MLERTAGCLESGSFRRLIPGSKTAGNRRLLHSGFWSHGTAELEMSPLWQALLQVSETRETAVIDTTRNSGAHPGGIFLDFLYPPGALSRLRRSPPWTANGLERRRHRGLFSGLGHRSYSAVAGEGKEEKDGDGHVTEPYLDDIEQEFDEHEPEEDWLDVTPNVEGSIRTTNAEITNAAAAPVLDIIRHGRSDDYEEAWRQFRLLDSDTQKLLTSEMVDYLSTSDRKPDARRTIQLFEEIRAIATEAQWRSLVRAQVILGNFEGAMEEHTLALTKFRKLIESDRLLGSLISNSQWDLAYEIWRDINDFKQLVGKSYRYDLWSYFTKLPDSVERALEITKYFKSIMGEDKKVHRFVGELILKALFPQRGIDSQQFVSLWKVYKTLNLDHHFFNRASTDVVLKLVHAKQPALALYLYKSIRSRTGLRYSEKFLSDLLKICCKEDDFQGQSMLLEDWAKCHGQPTSKAYRMCIEARASVGDAKKTHELFDAMFSTWGVRSPEDFNPLLDVHARRGELAECLEVFDEIKSKYGFRQTTTHQNILLSAYGKVGDVESASRLFENMLDSQKRRDFRGGKFAVDSYTIGTMMGICTRRGEFQSVYDIFNIAKEMGIRTTSAMVDCMVSTQIQRGQLEEAERLCKDWLHKVLDNKTRMWNYLLVAYALRRDIRNVYRIHGLMDSNDIPFDGHTYAALLLALSVAGQPLKAFKIMNEVMPEAGVKATNFHHAVVMGGFIRTKEYEKVITLHKRMLGQVAKQAVRQGASTRIQVAKAAAMLDLKYLQEGSPDEQFKMADQYFFEALTESDPMELASTSRKGMSGAAALDIAGIFSKFEYYILCAGQNRAFDKARELSQQFLALVPAARQFDIPLGFFSALMIAQYKEGNLEGVQNTWELAFSVAKHQTRSRQDDKLVLYSHRFDLTRALSTIIQAYRDQHKLVQLRVVIKQVQDAGFVLDSKNWNLYIQALTRAHHYTEAFELCESKLMSGWLGWQKVRSRELRRNRLDIVTRRKKEDPQNLRPIFHTLLYLTKAYLEMEGAVELDTGFQNRLKELEITCPKTLNAIRTMQREGDDLERVVLA